MGMHIQSRWHTDRDDRFRKIGQRGKKTRRSAVCGQQNLMDHLQARVIVLHNAKADRLRSAFVLCDDLLDLDSAEYGAAIDGDERGVRICRGDELAVVSAEYGRTDDGSSNVRGKEKLHAAEHGLAFDCDVVRDYGLTQVNFRGAERRTDVCTLKVLRGVEVIRARKHDAVGRIVLRVGRGGDTRCIRLFFAAR